MSQMINPHQAQPTSLWALINSLIKNRQLIYQMAKREVISRYKGSVMGLAWSFFNPILMLVIYTFVFSYVFKARWGENGSDSRVEFALILFVGLIIFNLFAETINRAPGIILGNVNYVKKVVFPLEIFSVISLGVAFFHAIISLVVMNMAFAVINHYLNWTLIFIPLILVPLVFFILGITWMLSSLGVYMRDVGQTIGILTAVLMFTSPVFYPISALPLKFQGIMMLNPLTFIIEQSRTVLIDGKLPDWRGLGIYTLVALLFMWLGYAWFQKTRKGFADVL